MQRDQTGRTDAIAGKDKNQPSGTVHFELYIGPDDLPAFQFWASGWHRVTSSIAIRDTNWHHVAATYDRTKMLLFLDGIQTGQASDSTPLLARAEPLQIGEKQSSAPFDYMNGKIDEVRIYSRALSVGEVHTLYESGFLPRLALASLQQRNGEFTFTVRGALGRTVEILASAGLSTSNWTSLGRLRNINGTIPFTDTEATNFHSRFYRVFVWP